MTTPAISAASPIASTDPGTATPGVPPPGRLVTGICMVVAPVVLTATCLLGSDIYKFHGRDFLTEMMANPARTMVFLNVVPLGIMMLMLAVVGLAGLVSHRAPRAAHLGLVATLVGLCGPMFFVAIEFCAYQLANPAHLAAGARMYDLANMVPRTTVNISGPLLVVGFVALAVAVRRAGLMSRFRAISLGLTALLPIGFIAAFLPISAIGFAFCSIALVPVGTSLLRNTGTDAAASRSESEVATAVLGTSPAVH